MIKSKIQFKNGSPMININGELFSPNAYTTYFDECGKWSDFIKSGYKMFFVNVSFTDLPINNFSGFTPFRVGVFDGDTPDYSEFDSMVRSIVAECPDALIFPRINIAMPRKWINENLYETVEIPECGRRESLYSDVFRHDGAELLKELVSHIRTADYAGRIAGYQLCGGTTQEWMHHDLCGSYSPMGIEKFCCSVKNATPPIKQDFDNKVLTDFYRFCSEEVTTTVEYFAKALKEFINNEQIVGVFYGYTAFVPDPLWGLHALGKIIDSEYIDFFSSPCCYDGNRKLGIDWGDMLPADSVKLHGKLYFVECDIRTHLTRRLHDSRPGEYPEDKYLTVDKDGNKTVWAGPDTPELSLSAIRKAFAHQITKSSGIWWFDMWGGWYHSKEIMAELEYLHSVYEKLKMTCIDGLPSAEIAFFIDEKAYANLARNNPILHSVNHTRSAMSNLGIPYDMYMVEDADKVLKKYKTAIFTAPIPSVSGKSAISICENLGIPYISASESKPTHTADEIRNFLVSSGVHCYNSDGCVIYCSNGILGIHTVCDGENKITLPGKYKIKPIAGINIKERETDTITFTAPKNTTLLFELSL